MVGYVLGGLSGLCKSTNKLAFMFFYVCSIKWPLFNQYTLLLLVKLNNYLGFMLYKLYSEDIFPSFNLANTFIVLLHHMYMSRIPK